MAYFDSNYLVRLYWEDAGWEVVRDLAREEGMVCCMHGRAEVIATFHRKLREGICSSAAYHVLLEQFKNDLLEGSIQWLPVTEAVLERLEDSYRGLPANVFLRAADALHLACARDNGFKEIHSNDERLLAAAPLFGLKGRNVIP